MIAEGAYRWWNKTKEVNLMPEKKHYDDAYQWKYEKDKEPVQKTRYELVDDISRLNREIYQLKRSAGNQHDACARHCELLKESYKEKEVLQDKLSMLQFLCDTLKIDYKAVLAAGKKGSKNGIR